MFCSHCGSPQQPQSAFCSSCGGALAQTTAPATTSPEPERYELFNTQSPNAVAAPKPNRWKRALIVGISVGLIIFAWNFFIRPALNGAGGVALDSALIEENIKAEMQKNGYNVTVECPDPMSGKVGDKRNCLVTDTDDGSKVMAVVTIENAQGAITWVTQ